MSLYKKLLEIQKLWLSVEKGAKNPFFKSSYVTLDKIVSVLTPILNEQWLVVIHTNIQNWVETKVIDIETDMFETSVFIVEWIKDPQKMWAVLTYWKRYNLASLFNIISDRDDDGNSFYTCKRCGKKCKPGKDYCSETCFTASQTTATTKDAIETTDLFD